MATSEAQLRAVKQYISKQESFCFRLRPDQDADVIEWLRAQPKITDAIRRLVREEIARQ